jgi:hypothetical protein
MLNAVSLLTAATEREHYSELWREEPHVIQPLVERGFPHISFNKFLNNTPVRDNKHCL